MGEFRRPAVGGQGALCYVFKGRSRLPRGRFLRLFIGNMASGKTRHLLTEIDTLRKYGNKKIAVFKPRTDVRSGMNLIKSRKGDEDSAEELPVTSPKIGRASCRERV